MSSIECIAIRRRDEKEDPTKIINFVNILLRLNFDVRIVDKSFKLSLSNGSSKGIYRGDFLVRIDEASLPPGRYAEVLSSSYDITFYKGSTTHFEGFNRIYEPSIGIFVGYGVDFQSVKDICETLSKLGFLKVSYIERDLESGVRGLDILIFPGGDILELWSTLALEGVSPITAHLAKGGVVLTLGSSSLLASITDAYSGVALGVEAAKILNDAPWASFPSSNYYKLGDWMRFQPFEGLTYTKISKSSELFYGLKNPYAWSEGWILEPLNGSIPLLQYQKVPIGNVPSYFLQQILNRGSALITRKIGEGALILSPLNLEKWVPLKKDIWGHPSLLLSNIVFLSSIKRRFIRRLVLSEVKPPEEARKLISINLMEIAKLEINLKSDIDTIKLLYLKSLWNLPEHIRKVFRNAIEALSYSQQLSSRMAECLEDMQTNYARCHKFLNSLQYVGEEIEKGEKTYRLVEENISEAFRISEMIFKVLPLLRGILVSVMDESTELSKILSSQSPDLDKLKSSCLLLSLKILGGTPLLVPLYDGVKEVTPIASEHKSGGLLPPLLGIYTALVRTKENLSHLINLPSVF